MCGERFHVSDTSNTNVITVAIDAMGGDFGPESAIPGLAIMHAENPKIHFKIYGDEALIYPLLNKHKSLLAVSQVHHTALTVKGEEKPSIALRSSKDTSMRLAIEAVKDGQADAVVSSGNTGALMAMSKMVLKTVPELKPLVESAANPQRWSLTLK